MIKRILSIFLSFVICLSIFTINVYAKEDKAYQMYQAAIQKTMASGSWSESLNMTANMTISNGSAQTKTKATVTSDMDISNYYKNDSSKVNMSGSASMNLMGQVYEWDITYENGIAHYEYTAPNQTTVDLEVNPNCFNFNTLTEDMMEKAKVSGNKITFTIPDSKIEKIEISAINLMSGIDNLNYDDIDVEVIIDKANGTVDKMRMIFHASMKFQGYDAEVDYDIDYDFSTKNNSVIELEENNTIENEIENGLIIYSDYKNLSIRKDSTITLSAGVIVNGELIKDVSGITFQTEDSSVLSFSDTGVKDNRRYVKFKGIDVGTTQVIFSDSQTGYSAKVLVSVYDNNYLSYTLNSVPTQYIEKYPTNIYNANGLYMDNYHYVVNDNKTATVSFDIYNTNFTYGVVEVYNENGSLENAVLIEKMSLNNTSIKTAVWDNTFCFIRDIVELDMGTYRQESGYSKKTSVIVEIPENGYIKICNNPQNSAVVNIVNSVDILMSLSELTNDITNYNVKSEVFSKDLTTKLVKEKAFASLVEDGSELQKELWKGVAKEVVFSTESLGNFSDTIVKNLNEFDLSKLIVDTAADFSWNLGEDVFQYFTGPIKMVFDGLFTFGKLENIIWQHVDLIQSSNVGSIYIQNQGGGTRSSQQITVKNDIGFSEDTSLNVFRVTLKSDILDILKETNPKIYNAIVNGTSYTYNISLLKNGMETQPNGEVTVYIPIPDDLKFLAHIGKTKIFRVEEDGTLTEMVVEIEDGCFTFNTSHFSLYTLVGSIVYQNIIIIVVGVIFIVCILFLFLRIIKWKKEKRGF